MMKRFGNAIAALLVSVMTLSVVPLQAYAASNSISVNPRKNYTIQPGGTQKDTITVRNTDKTSPLNLSVIPLDFNAKDQTGAANLLLTRKDPTAWSLRPYLTIQKNATIQPGESMSIPLQITMPKGIGAGSYYSAIQFSTGGTAAPSGNVGLSGSAVTLLFVKVPGQAKDSEILKNFGATVPATDFSNAEYQTFFGATKPKYLSYTLQNEGNVVDEPHGSIQIKNMFGKQYQLIQNINPNHNLVILGQTRRIDVCITAPAGSSLADNDSSSEDLTKCQSPSMLPGRYTAKIDLLYGAGNGTPESEITGNSTFWYLPAWFIIVVLLAILVIVGIIWAIVRAIRNRGSGTYKTRR